MRGAILVSKVLTSYVMSRKQPQEEAQNSCSLNGTNF